MGIGCSSHIGNNSIRCAVERSSYDVKGFATAITDHFSNHPGRWERFQEIGEENEVWNFSEKA